ncbi:MAG: aspartate/glutamate racemase family protein [Pseudomonadota bacterium]
MHIGLIGGIGPAATDLYYRGLVDAMKALGAELEMTIVHADAATLVRNFEAKQPQVQAAIYLRLTERLVAAGAEVVAITSIGGHFCIEEFRPLSPLPIIDFVAEMDRFLARQTFAKVGLLGTDTVMETRFYGGIKSTEVLVPPPDVIAKVHRAYVDMAINARVTEEQRTVMFEAGRALTEQGAETVLLGGTDLFLVFDGHDPGFATLDCATVHIDAIASMASR